MREDRDIKQSTLAKYLGVHQTTYSSYEIGKLSLTADVLVKLAKYYNTSVDYLLGLTDDTKPFPKSRQWGVIMENEPLKIKKRGDDGYRFISVRIKESTLSEIDKVATESNYSRNELINLILEHGIKNIEIE